MLGTIINNLALGSWLRDLIPIPSAPRGHGSQFLTDAMTTEKFEDHHEGWRTLWLTIAGVIAITLTWNVLMLSLKGISY